MAIGTKGSLHVPIAKMSRTIVIHGINDLCPIWHCPTALLPELQQTLSPALVIVVLSRGFGRSDGSVISSLPEQINDFLYNFLRYTYSTIFFNLQQPACCLFSPRQLLLHLQSPRGSAWVQGGRRLPWKSWSKPAPEAKCAEGGACLGQLVDMITSNLTKLLNLMVCDKSLREIHQTKGNRS